MNIKQYKFLDIKEKLFDAIIVSSGFESRASYQSMQFESLPVAKIALCFDSETSDKTRKLNDAYFVEREFEMITVNSDVNSLELFTGLIKKIIDNSVDKDEICIYIDYSSMVRNWYATIIQVVSNFNSVKPINLYFGYSHAKYIPSSNLEKLNRIVEPLFGYCNLSVPYKPTALIICLGNEKNRVYGLQEYFDAATYLFYSDSSFDNEYSEEVERVNSEVLKSTNAENVFRFPVHDLIYTSYLIENLCKVLLYKFRVIIAPCGAKSGEIDHLKPV